MLDIPNNALLPEDTPTDLLGDFQPIVPTGGPKAAARTSLLGVMAKTNFETVLPADIPQLAETLLSQITNGEEADVRANIHDAYTHQRQQGLATAAFDAYERGDVPLLTELLGKEGLMETVGAFESKYTLEKAGVDGLKNNGLKDPTQAKVATIVDFDQDQAIADFHKKLAIMQTDMAKANEEHNNTGLAETVLNYAAMVVPFNLLTSELGGDKETTLTLQTGKAIAAQRKRFLDMSMAEFEEVWPRFVEQAGKGLIGENPVFKRLAISEMLQGLTTEQQIDHTKFSLFEGALAPFDVAGALKAANAAKNVFRFTKTLDRASTVDNAANTIALAAQGTPEGGSAVSKVLTVDDAVEVLLPSASANTQDISVGMSGSIVKELEVQQQAITNLLRDRRTERLTPEEALTAFEAEKTRLMNLYKGSHIEDVKLLEPESVTGLRQTEILLGKASGKGGYSTEQAAMNSARKRNLADVTPIQDPSGQWFLSQKHILPEEGFVVPPKINEVKAIDRIAAVLTNPLGWLPKQIGINLQIAISQKARMNKLIRTVLRPSIDSLSSSEKTNVGKMLELGEDHNWVDAAGRERNGKWWTNAELDAHFQRDIGRLPTDKEKLAYYTYKNINDLDWSIRNTQEYVRRARLGYKRVMIDDLAFDGRGKELSTIQNLDAVRIYDVTAKRYYGEGELSAIELDKRLKDNGVLYRLEQTVHAGNDPIDIVLGKRGDFRVEKLDPVVVPYREGGHRIYTGKYLVKQANFGTYMDGKKWKDTPLTHTIFDSAEDAARYADEHEVARNAVLKYKKDLTDESFDAMQTALERVEINGLDEWTKLLNERGIAEDTPFEVVFDRELPKEYDKGASAYFDISNKEAYTDDTSVWLVHNNKAYTGRRGERLKQPKDMEAKTLDPFEAQDKALRHALRINAMGDFRVRAMEEWVEMAKALDALDPGSIKEGGNTAKVFFDAQYLKKATNPDIVRLENLRNVIKEKLGQLTFDDIADIGRRKRFAEWVEGKTGLEASRTLEYTNAESYLGAMRGWTFDSYLGFLNPGQFMFQISTAAGIMAMKMDLRSLPTAMTMRAMLGNTKIGKDLPNAWRHIHGMETSEFSSMMKDLRASGFTDVADTGLYLEGNSLSRIRQIGRKPLYEAETLNRLVAWNIAYKEALAKGLKAGSREIFRDVLDRASALTMDMGEASRTMLQRGLPGVMTQFQQYTLNTVQNMARTKGLEGYSRWTNSERNRYALGQMALWGSAAIPLGESTMEWVATKYENDTDRKLPREAYKLLQTGSIDALLHWASDGKWDSAMGARAGFGVGIARTLGDMWAKKPLEQILLGPSYQLMSEYQQSIMNVMTYISTSTNPDGITNEAAWNSLLEMARNVSSVKEYEKAYNIYRKGIILSKGGTPIGEASKLQALASLMGFPASVEHDTQLLFASNTNTQEGIDTIVKQMVEHNMRASMADTLEEKLFFARANQTLLKDEDPRIQQEILKEVARRTTTPMYEGIANKNWKLKGGTPLNELSIERRKERINQQETQ